MQKIGENTDMHIIGRVGLEVSFSATYFPLYKLLFGDLVLFGK